MPDRPLQTRARKMRLAPTPAERAVWRLLRAAPFHALHFLRQVPFANRSIAEFASHRARVIIEIDGAAHVLDGQAENTRTAWLAAQGWHPVMARVPATGSGGAAECQPELAWQIGKSSAASRLKRLCPVLHGGFLAWTSPDPL